MIRINVIPSPRTAPATSQRGLATRLGTAACKQRASSLCKRPNCRNVPTKSLQLSVLHNECIVNPEFIAMPITTTIARRTLLDELLPRLNDMIIDGELDPGCRIPEEALCARFGVSRTPLREALKMLSVKGLVHLLPNKGANVVRITQQEAEELIPLLGIIESHASERACARIDQAGITRITELHVQLIENHRCGDEQTYLRTNRALHGTIVAAAGN